MWVSWQLKSSAIKLFVPQIEEANKKEMLHIIGHLYMMGTHKLLWFLLTKGQ